MNLILDTPVKARLYHYFKELGVSIGERLIAAIQIRGKKRPVVQWYPTSSLNQARTITHADCQFKGHVLVSEIQQATSPAIPVPVNRDGNRIITQVPPVLPSAFTVNSQPVPVPSTSIRKLDLRPLS